MRVFLDANILFSAAQVGSPIAQDVKIVSPRMLAEEMKCRNWIA